MLLNNLVSFKHVAAVVVLAFALQQTVALPLEVAAVEYGMHTCPHCLHLKEVLRELNITFTFVDILLNEKDFKEYSALYETLVGGTKYVPFTIYFIRNKPRLAVVGYTEPRQLSTLLNEASGSEALIVFAEGEVKHRILNESLISHVADTVGAHLRGKVLGNVKLVTPFDTPLSQAQVFVSCEDGQSYRAASDASGFLELRCRRARLTVEQWLAAPLNYTIEVNMGDVVKVRPVGKVTVTVTGALNQPLPNVEVRFINRWAELVGTTGSDGSLTAVIPAGAYSLKVSKGGKVQTFELNLKDESTEKLSVTLDVALTLGEVCVGLYDLLLLLLAVAVASASLYMLAKKVRASKPKGESVDQIG